MSLKAALGGNAGKFVIGITVSLAIIVLMVRSLDLRLLMSTLAGADLRPVVPAVACYFLGIWARSIRWQLLLPRGAAPTRDLYKALLVGFTINDLAPVRVGEVARAYLLRRWRGVPYGTTLASLVVERVLDGLALTALLGVGLWFAPAPGYVRALGALAAVLFLTGSGVIALAAWRSQMLGASATRIGRFLPARIGDILIRLAEGFTRGLGSLRNGRLLVQLAGLSLLAWLLELGLFYCVLYAFPLPRSVPLALVSGAVANFATLIPSSPGYVGTFDGALTKIVADMTTASTETAAAYALLTHAALFLPVIIAGLTLLWRSKVSFEGLVKVSTPSVEEQHAPVAEVPVLTP